MIKFYSLKMVYTGIKINVSESQKRKLESSTDKIVLSFSYDDLLSEGSDNLYVTNTQLVKIKKSIDNKKGVKLNISKSQLKYNIKNGGFLGALAGLASKFLPGLLSKILPAIGIGALTGGVSTGVSKLLGSGLYLKRGGCVVEIEKHGDGIFLKPFTGRHNFTRNGLYSGDGLYLNNKTGDGIFGDLFRSVPILGSLF